MKSIGHRDTTLKMIQVELTDRLALEMDKLVEEGWFREANEITRLALADFLQHRRFELQMKHQVEDIARATRERA